MFYSATSLVVNRILFEIPINGLAATHSRTHHVRRSVLIPFHFLIIFSSWSSIFTLYLFFCSFNSMAVNMAPVNSGIALFE